MEGALAAIKCAREHDLPLLATGGGFHHVVMEYARNVLGLTDTSQAAYDPFASRLFAGWPHDAPQSELDLELVAGSVTAGSYGCATAREHDSGDIRIAPEHVAALEAAGLRVSGRDRRGDPQIVELGAHPFYVATLFLPHLASSAQRAHPLVRAFVGAACERAYGELAH
jgi:CTP synthase (UTP-ammonia lyase)